MNNKRLTTKEFIKKANKIHGNKYNYSKTNYILSKENVSIICPKHNVFLQRASAHLKGQGCVKCSAETRSVLNRSEVTKVIKKFNLKHNNKYDYSKVKYINNYTDIIIICPEHGEFLQAPNHHMKGRGCKLCSFNKKKSTIQKFIKKSNEVHNKKYDYSLVKYKNCDTKVKIICPIHGEFEQTPYNHASGGGCVLCGIEKTFKKRTFTTEQFIANAKKIHLNKYDYSLVEYVNSNTKVKIICKKHGVFEQVPYKHINSGQGCSKCKNSIGENKIIEFLENNHINYMHQKKFLGCKLKYLLPFDFYLPEHDICIEYDGKQHFEPIKRFGGEKEFKLRIKRDKIKTDYCKQKGIKLLRIKYNEKIEDKLRKLLP